MSKCKTRRGVASSKAIVSAAVLTALAAVGSAYAQNTAAIFNTSATDLSDPASYATTLTPTAASAFDVEFTGTYTTPTLDVNGSALNFGTLDDLSTQALVIANSNTTAGSITLSTPANSLSPSASDLLYVATGGNLSINNSTGTGALIIGATGNIDAVGALSVYTPITITPGNTVSFTGTGTSNLNGSIGSTTAALIQANTGTIALYGSNGYSGGTSYNVSGGFVRVANNNALGTGAVTFNANGTLATQINGPATTLANNITINSSTTASFDGGYATLTLNGNITGGGAVSKVSSGYVILSGSNSYTGGTALTGGFTTFTSTAAIPTTGQISISSGAAIVDTGAYPMQPYINSASTSGTILNTSAGTIALNLASSSENFNFTGYTALGLGATGTSTYTGSITPSLTGYFFSGATPSNLTVASNLTTATTLTKSGTGTTILTGTNTYTGLTSVTGGALILSGAGSYTGGLSIGSGTTLTVSAGTSINTGSGAITLKSAALNVGGILTSTASMAIGTNSGNLVDVLPGGVLTLPGFSDSWQSNFTVNGLLNVTGASTMAVNAVNTISGTGTFNVSGLSLSNSTNIVDSVANFNIIGTLGLGSSGGTTFNVNGGVMTATAVSNSYNYNLIDNGVINVANTWQSAFNSLTRTWTGTGTLNVGSFNLSNLTMITSTLAAFNVSGAVQIGETSGNSLGIFAQNSGVVNFTSASSNIVIGVTTSGTNYGGYFLSGGTFNVPNASIIVGSGASANAVLNITGGTANLYGVSFNGTGASNFNVSGGAVNIGAGGINSTATGIRNVSFGAVTVGSFGSWSSNVPITLNSPTVTTFNTLDSVNNTTARTVTLNGAISGTGGLNITGPGAVVLGGSATFSGPTNVSSGQLFVNSLLSSATTLTISPGTTIGGAGNIASTVALPSGSNLAAGYGGTGTLTVAGLTFGGTSNLSIGTLSNYAVNPALNVLGTLTTSGAANSVTILVSNLVGTTPGSTYVLASYSGGTIAGTGNSAFILGALPGGTQGVLSFPNGQIDLTLGGANLLWTGANGSAWDTATSNWATVNSSGGVTAAQYVDNVGEQVLFGDSVGGTPVTNTTVNLNTATYSPAGTTFNNSTTNYTIQSSNGKGIGGAGGITLNGTGTVTITTSNSFTGGTLLNAGLLAIPNDSALGAAPSTPTTNITFNGTGSIQFTGPTTLNANRSIVLNGTGTIDVDSNAVSIPGVISGSGVLTPANTGNLSSGVLSLSGNNTFTGGTTLNPFVTLNIANDASLGAVPVTATTSLLANGGTLQAGASGISLGANRIVAINSGGLTVDENSNSIAITGQVEGTGPLYVVNTGNGSGGVLKLNTTATNTDTGPLIITAGTVSIGNSGTNYVYTGQDFSTINVSSGATLIFAGTNTFGYAGSGSFKPAIYINGGTVTNANTDNYIGGQITMVGGTINGQDDFRLQAYTAVSSYGMVTTLASSTTATISTPAFNLVSSNALFTVAQGMVPAGGPDLLVSSNISGPSLALNKAGPGVMTLSGANTYTSGTNVMAGVLNIASPKAFPTFTNLTVTGGVAVASPHTTGATGAAKNNLFVNSLSLAGGTGAWTGQVDLNNNDMIVQASGNGTNLGNITNMVAQGYNNGAWNGPGGIVSTSAANSTTHLTALGVISNDDGTGSGTPLYGSGAAVPNTFDGAANTVDGDILIKYTYYGDTDLNGEVDGTDYSRIDNSFLSEQMGGPSVTGWFNGDFNFDGVVDGSDYTLMDNAFNQQGAQIASLVAAPTAQISGPGTAVPEPATMSLLGLGAIGLLSRRRRR